MRDSRNQNQTATVHALPADTNSTYSYNPRLVMKERNAAFLLLLTAFIWGLSFVAQSLSSDLIGPFTFNSIRFFLGAAVLIPFALPGIRKASAENGWWKRTLTAGAVCGLCLASASVTQQIGISYSGAGKGGFITSTYIVIVPFISLIFGKKIEKKTWLSALIAIAGMYLLCMSQGTSISTGDLWLILCAILFSFHIIAIDRLGKNTDGITMSMMQFLVAGILTLPGLFIENNGLGTVLSAWLPLLYSGVFSCGIAYTLQVVAQKHVQPQKAVLLLSLESVFSAIGGALLLAERMTGWQLAGCALVFAAVLIAELDFSFVRRK